MLTLKTPLNDNLFISRLESNSLILTSNCLMFISILITHTNTHLNEVADKIYYLLQNTPNNYC